jgi:hypothetical protein
MLGAPDLGPAFVARHERMGWTFYRNSPSVYTASHHGRPELQLAAYIERNPFITGLKIHVDFVGLSPKCDPKDRLCSP